MWYEKDKKYRISPGTHKKRVDQAQRPPDHQYQHRPGSYHLKGSTKGIVSDPGQPEKDLIRTPYMHISHQEHIIKKEL